MRLFLGDSVEVLKKLPDNSIHSVVTDPPYGISFMGKKWDYDTPSVELWSECLRVLRPGGHLLAFAGARTQHRMATKIEDSGFELRDMMAWVYGSGFPKSMDVALAIDRIDRLGPMRERALEFTAWMRSTGLTPGQINEATGTFMGSHYLTDKSQPSVPTPELFDKIRPLVGEVPERVEELIRSRVVESENMKRRRVVGKGKSTIIAKTGGSVIENGVNPGAWEPKEYEVTAAYSPEAQAWEGWGTTLKPALEPLTLARKPLDGTVAANVLKWGVGGLNLAACRIGDRHPATLIHDGGEEVEGCLGHASRFFYCPKPNRKDRDQGLPEGLKNLHPTVKPVELMRYLCRLVTPKGGVVLDPFMGSGSTGVAAQAEGFDFIGVDMDPEFFQLARMRLGVDKEDGDGR